MPAKLFKASPGPVLAAGMEIAFLDFSSGQHSDHQKVLDSIRTVEQELGCTIAGATAPVLQLIVTGPPAKSGTGVGCSLAHSMWTELTHDQHG